MKSKRGEIGSVDDRVKRLFSAYRQVATESKYLGRVEQYEQAIDGALKLAGEFPGSLDQLSVADLSWERLDVDYKKLFSNSYNSNGDLLIGRLEKLSEDLRIIGDPNSLMSQVYERTGILRLCWGDTRLHRQTEEGHETAMECFDKAIGLGHQTVTVHFGRGLFYRSTQPYKFNHKHVKIANFIFTEYGKAIQIDPKSDIELALRAVAKVYLASEVVSVLRGIEEGSGIFESEFNGMLKALKESGVVSKKRWENRKRALELGFSAAVDLIEAQRNGELPQLYPIGTTRASLLRDVDKLTKSGDAKVKNTIDQLHEACSNYYPQEANVEESEKQAQWAREDEDRRRRRWGHLS